MAITRDQVVDALRTVRDKQSGRDLVALQAAHDIRLDDQDVYLRLDLAALPEGMRGSAQAEAMRALRSAGAADVHIDLIAPAPASNQPDPSRPLPQVKNVIAVGAGKGGVGKSTVALNLAIGLHRMGARVGLMDGDIYGPSMPTMLGIKGQPPTLRGPKIVPYFVHGIHAITIGALVDPDKPLIWRGPMAHGAFKQLLLDNTDWPALDYLVVDLPPGTGDVPLSLCQMLRIIGAVVVATPQQVALDDAVRAVGMFNQLQTPVLGIVENMSYFIDPTGIEHDIFGRGGAERAADRLKLPYLGAIPMVTEMRVNSDAGNPTANFNGNPALKTALESLAMRVAQEVGHRNAQGSGPKLNIV